MQDLCEGDGGRGGIAHPAKNFAELRLLPLLLVLQVVQTVRIAVVCDFSAHKRKQIWREIVRRNATWINGSKSERTQALRGACDR